MQVVTLKSRTYGKPSMRRWILMGDNEIVKRRYILKWVIHYDTISDEKVDEIFRATEKEYLSYLYVDNHKTIMEFKSEAEEEATVREYKNLITYAWQLMFDITPTRIEIYRAETNLLPIILLLGICGIAGIIFIAKK